MPPGSAVENLAVPCGGRGPQHTRVQHKPSSTSGPAALRRAGTIQGRCPSPRHSHEVVPVRRDAAGWHGDVHRYHDLAAAVALPVAGAGAGAAAAGEHIRGGEAREVARGAALLVQAVSGGLGACRRAYVDLQPGGRCESGGGGGVGGRAAAGGFRGACRWCAHRCYTLCRQRECVGGSGSWPPGLLQPAALGAPLYAHPWRVGRARGHGHQDCRDDRSQRALRGNMDFVTFNVSKGHHKTVCTGPA